MITTPHKRPHKRQEVLKNISTAGVDLTKLVLYSTFDDDNRVTDLSGGENHGTLSGAFIDAGGRYGKSMFLDTVDDQCTFANENNFDIGATEDFTVWFWVNPFNVGLSVPWLKGATTNYYDLVLGAQTLSFEVDDGILPTQTAGSGGPSLVIGKWYCIACVFDRTVNTANVYLDGDQYGATADITGLGAISNADSFIVGHPTNAWGSNTDIVGFAKQALDITTIKNLCRMGL